MPRWIATLFIALIALTGFAFPSSVTNAVSAPAAGDRATISTQAKRVPPDATTQSLRYICGNSVTLRAWPGAGAPVISSSPLTWYDTFDEFRRDGAWSQGYSHRLQQTGFLITQYLC